MFSTISKPSPCSTYTQRKPFGSQAKANLSSSVPKGISAVPRSNEVSSLSKLKSAGAALLASTALVGFQWSAVASEMALIAENPIQAIEKAAGNVAEGVEEAIDGPSANRASAPSGSMGKVTNLADKNLEGGAQFDSAASKLKGDSARQYEAGQEVDKAIQKESEFKAASQFKKNNPGSETGNSTVDRVKNQFIGN